MFVKALRTRLFLFITTVFLSYNIAILCASNACAEHSPVETPSQSLLKVGDKISIVIDGENDLTGLYVVDKAGMIDMPLIGSVLVAGKTPYEAKMLITQKLEDGYLKDPAVAVKGEAPVESKPCKKSPGPDKAPKMAKADMKEPPHPPAAPMLPMDHGKEKMPPPSEHHKSLKPYAEMGKHVYVVGAVRYPGYYLLPPKAGHLLNSIALAGGYADNADTKEFEIIRDIDGAYYRKHAQSGALEYKDGDIIVIGEH